MYEMNWKRQVVYPVLRAIAFTLASFLAVMIVASVWSAIWIWGLDRFDPKWGDRWGNFWFNAQIFSMMAGAQAGVTFVGSTIYALIRKTIPARWAAITIVVLCAMNHLVPLLIDINGPCAMTGLFGFPAIALLVLLVPVLQRDRGDIQQSPGTYSSKAADGLTENAQE